MPDTSPLRPSDPERLGSYRLLGRLGDGGQGVVYLGENASGHRFAIKWLRADLAADPVGRERFIREVAAAQRVAAFCTAQIVETGVEQDRPYIVSEYIDGPSLQALVRTSGPRTGSGLHRLAVTTATALTAIHRAGIVHRDLKPANVLMGPDGPCVIDFGIAKALDSAATVTSRPIGTPSYMSPEQFTGETAGAPADMFAWACTMVYAATGEPPFGADAVAAVIHRILTVTPDLDRLPGTLREVVAACLDKDPARRPTAEQVLLHLLQQQDTPGPVALRSDVPGPSLLQRAAAVAARPGGEPGPADPAAAPPPDAPNTQGATRSPAPTRPPADDAGRHPSPPPGPASPADPHGPYRIADPASLVAPPRSSRRRLAIAGTATALALALSTAGILVVLNGQGRTVSADGTPATASTTITASTPIIASTPIVSTPAAGTPTPAPATKLPGSTATVYEHPDDKISLAYYRVGAAANAPHYTRRSRTGSFRLTRKYARLSISPDGRYEARLPKDDDGDPHVTVNLVDRQTGRSRAIKTVKRPLSYYEAIWSEDSERMLLTIKDVPDWTTIGFIVIDAEAGTAKITRIADGSAPDDTFFWSGDGTQVAAAIYGGEDGEEVGLRFYDLDGKESHEIKGIGQPNFDGSRGPFSPSGRLLFTLCPGDRQKTCVWDTTTPRWTRVATIKSITSVLDWYDESHLVCRIHGKSGRQVKVIDLRGNTVRVLLDEPRKKNEPEISDSQITYLQFARNEHG